MTRFIAIDGHGGSGKTHISKLLAERIGAKVYNLDTYGDDFHPFIGIPALIDDLKQASEDTVIYEGVGVFDPRFDEFNAFRIFVSTSNNVRANRVANRDVPRADRSAQDWQKIFKIWDVAEQEYFTPELIQSANLSIYNDESVDVAAIAKDLELFWAKP